MVATQDLERYQLAIHEYITKILEGVATSCNGHWYYNSDQTQHRLDFVSNQTLPLQ